MFTDKLNIKGDTLHGGANLVTYNLKAVISHIGDKISGGHYIATTRLDASSAIWHTYSDSYCKAIRIEQVQKQQAYLLFYEKEISTAVKQKENCVSLNSLTLSEIHHELTDKQFSKVSWSEVQYTNSKLLGGISARKKGRQHNRDKNSNQPRNQQEPSNAIQNPSSETLPSAQSTENVNQSQNEQEPSNAIQSTSSEKLPSQQEPSNAIQNTSFETLPPVQSTENVNQPQNEQEPSNAIQNTSSEKLLPAQSTAHLQRPRKRKLHQKVIGVKQNQDKHLSTTPNTTTSSAQPSKRRKQQKPKTKPKPQKKRNTLKKKKKSKGKKKAVRDYKRENELRKIRRLAKRREEELKKQKEAGYK